MIGFREVHHASFKVDLPTVICVPEGHQPTREIARIPHCASYPKSAVKGDTFGYSFAENRITLEIGSRIAAQERPTEKQQKPDARRSRDDPSWGHAAIMRRRLLLTDI
jgi:hypothetical protein